MPNYCTDHVKLLTFGIVVKYSISFTELTIKFNQSGITTPCCHKYQEVQNLFTGNIYVFQLMLINLCNLKWTHNWTDKIFWLWIFNGKIIITSKHALPVSGHICTAENLYSNWNVKIYGLSTIHYKLHVTGMLLWEKVRSWYFTWLS